MNETNAPSRPAEVRRVLIRWVIVLAAVGAFALWAAWRMNTAAARLPGVLAAGKESPAPAAAIEYWTCTMHPDVRQPAPGNCPRCGMTLVPKYVGSDQPGVAPEPPASQMPTGKAEVAPKAWYKCTMPECNDPGSDDPDSRCPVCGMKREPVVLDVAQADAGQGEITLSERARRLAELATEPVARRLLFKRIRTVGKVTYDETRHKMVSAWTGGRIDRLFADYTGMVVNQGDHLVEIYSPDLLTAQEEFLQALHAASEIRASALEPARRSAEQLVASARQKLALLGITAEQIEQIERTGTATTHLVLHAPIGGTIVRKMAVEGMYVNTGDGLYEIADLTRVWLLIDVYEADLPWVRPFQEVNVTAQSLPGETFTGRIVFVDPVVDPMTRTIKVRVNVDNPQRRLKPEMFVTAELRAAVGADTRAAVPRAGGAFVCPMHPWETADALETCPICGMNMVSVASIPGYATPSAPAELLCAPREAVMKTGERSLVYVETHRGTYLGVEVQVGPLVEDESGQQFYPLLAGLQEGQLVVTRGNFVIDSQMQIAGKPSLFDARGLGAADEPPIQKLCPVMGGQIDPDAFIIYKGVKIYFCCPGCDAEFLKHPEQYIPKLPPAIQQRIHAAQPDAGGHAHD